ncbi:GntR family transcriptional regulator [Mycobacterium spongiae]|uniref:GntR family transcriptional regulator n=1 Tax=Mycobacterium spongiae TaxID=886343 RepID=A0A975K1G2_9MYCO|nr:GntR family transcriptional regulator [Mycobacterium spongiae]
MLPLGQIDHSDRRPPYRQIAGMLRDAIEHGYYSPDGRLPSEAELSGHFSVARMTVRRALQELRDEGLVYSEHGKGVFVRPTPRWVPEGFEIQIGLTTFVGRSHTEIARLIAHDHGWRIRGDEIIEPGGQVVAATLEELARRALALGWYEPSGVSINWHRFGGAKSTNADTIRRVQA